MIIFRLAARPISVMVFAFDVHCELAAVNKGTVSKDRLISINVKERIHLR